MPISSNKMKSSYELLFREKFTIKNLKVLRSPCYVYVSDSKRSKLDAKQRSASLLVMMKERKDGSA